MGRPLALERAGFLSREDEEQSYLLDPDGESLLYDVLGHSITYRIAGWAESGAEEAHSADAAGARP
jgi:hypothetical protein